MGDLGNEGGGGGGEGQWRGSHLTLEDRLDPVCLSLPTPMPRDRQKESGAPLGPLECALANVTAA